MLIGINITNIALIKKLSLDFSEGLNILSGETGAGKSIIIDSLNFVLGERADKTLIRHGESVAEVEASFYFGENQKVVDALDALGIESEDGLVILRRTLNLSGRSDIRINGHTATLSMLKSVSGLLCDIHGQHEHQSLLKVATHIDILDDFGESEVGEEKLGYFNLFNEYKEVCRKLSEMGNREAQARELDMLEYAVKEIDGAELYEGIEEEIVSNRTKFQNIEKLMSSVGIAVGLLGGEEQNCQDSLRRAYTNLVSVEKYDSDLSEIISRIESARIEIDDIASTLSSQRDSYEFNAEKAEDIERKYETLKNLKRKYGSTVEQILEYREDADKRRQELILGAENTEILEERKGILEDKLYTAAKKLSDKRKAVAKSLEESISSELSELGMGGTQFSVAFVDFPEKGNHVDKLTSNGCDSLEFLISPNKGEPLRSLSKIISGGEMSRFMLALKVIFASIDGIGTLVFDEIDTGISGKIAFEVAKKLYKISRFAQVIAVTHLSQLAAVADNNYLIEKKTEGDSTRTYVYPLSDEDKLKEVSRLSGGVENSGTSIEHAEELIKSFSEFKNNL